MRASSMPIFSGERTKSTNPLAMAFSGIVGNLALVESSAKVMPPAVFTASTPAVPSAPVPDRMTPTASSPRSVASERRKQSIGCSAFPRGARTNRPEATVISTFDGMTWTRFGRNIIPSIASHTGICVAFSNKPASWLSCLGSRCCTSTKAIPASGGSPLSNCTNASNPPAEAPIPATGKFGGRFAPKPLACGPRGRGRSFFYCQISVRSHRRQSEPAGTASRRLPKRQTEILRRKWGCSKHQCQ